MDNKYVRLLVVAFVFGLLALGIVLAGFTIPLSVGVVSDPRELFVTVGAALTGPIGAVIIGILAGVAEPGGIPLASLLGHIAGALWMGFAYKKLVYERLEMPVRLLGWAGLIVVYYIVFVLPGFAIGLNLFYGGESFITFYPQMLPGVIPEMIITTVVTTLVMLALPKQFQKPLW